MRVRCLTRRRARGPARPQRVAARRGLRGSRAPAPELGSKRLLFHAQRPGRNSFVSYFVLKNPTAAAHLAELPRAHGRAFLIRAAKLPQLSRRGNWAEYRSAVPGNY